ncbi:MAG: ATP-binding protein [Clostridiales bacterium]|jgi:predicted AAA+ superfamily ATPase|nr:ATP-binding protein [Clostridiales bacterium]MDR2713215.1 ATP-binding protein [Clostridiales bacterium]
MIERKEYMNRLIGYRDKQVIKIITGIRRCGKSTLLFMYQQYLLKGGVETGNIITINFEDYDNRSLCDPGVLHDYIKSHMAAKGRTYVFLDEIQNVPEFQRVVDSLYLRKNLDIYLTGSNAWLLSGDLATLLSGRYVEIEMLPLSFREYVSVVGADDLSRKYIEYLENSSFPGALEFLGNQKHISGYLQGVYDSVVLKDVVGRYRIPDTMMLESLVRFAFDNIGSQLSTKSISNTMNADSRKIDVKTVERYLKALMDSFILYQAKRYNIKGKQYLKTLEKYYAVDIGMRYLLLGKRGLDVGHILENVVYLELLRRGYQVYVGKVDELEVDFVAMDQSGRSYFQVAATVREQTTLERELAPLKKISDHYPKYILTLDEDPEADYEGIRKIRVLDWLLGNP